MYICTRSYKNHCSINNNMHPLNVATKGQEHVSIYAIYLSYYVLNILKCLEA